MKNTNKSIHIHQEQELHWILLLLVKKLKRNLDKIIEKCGKDVSISTHMIQSDKNTQKSVCEADHFFKGVKVIKTLDEFILLIQKDRKLQGIDVAKYILSKIKCTQLKLQKLVYLCFANYLCDKGKVLFIDKIYAFKYYILYIKNIRNMVTNQLKRKLQTQILKIYMRCQLKVEYYL